MATIKSTLRLNDAMSGALRRINSAMAAVLESFDAVKEASGENFDTGKIAAARREIALANDAIEEMEDSYRAAARGQENLNDRISEGTSAADGLLGKVKSIGIAYAMKKGADWISGSLDLFDTQLNAETQLSTVLGNVGAAEGAMDRLKTKASELQKTTVFGDEALIGGAGEFATYMSDDAAISVMMDTLANYAAGMSGGGEVGYQEMVDYATGLGKVINGSYDAMTKKGFEFTEAQKEIIEKGTEMEKALVISDVINESWDGLAERMSNTPAGKIIQLKNAFGDMREDLASRIYPTVMQLFDAISANTGRAANFITGLAKPINLIIKLIVGIINIAGKVSDFFSEHWTIIAPIVYAIAGALAVYYGAQLAANAITLISTGIHYAQAAAKMLLAAVTGTLTAATAAQIATQTGLNAALYACPIVWIIMAVVALIAVIIGVVAWIKKSEDASISTLGAVMGALFTAGAAIWNLILALFEQVLGVINYLVNPFIAFGNFIANVFRDPVGSVIKLFGDMADVILRMLQSIAAAMDKIFGSNLAAAVSGWRSSLSTKIETAVSEKGNGNYEEVISKIDLSVDSLGLKRWDYSDAWNSGVATGNKWNDQLSGMFDTSSITGTGLGAGIDDLNDVAGDIADNSGRTASNTAKSNEELAYLRDIAEKEAINRFTTAEIRVDMSGMTNRIESEMDIDGVISYLAEGIEEALITAGEGVY